MVYVLIAVTLDSTYRPTTLIPLAPPAAHNVSAASHLPIVLAVLSPTLCSLPNAQAASQATSFPHPLQLASFVLHPVPPALFSLITAQPVPQAMLSSTPTHVFPTVLQATSLQTQFASAVVQVIALTAPIMYVVLARVGTCRFMLQEW